MTSLSFPDVNVWLALALEHHTHRAAALAWWNQDRFDRAGFTRFTQVSVLRLLTTAAAMDGQPLTMGQAWQVYDGFVAVDREALFAEPAGFESGFESDRSRRLRRPRFGRMPIFPVSRLLTRDKL